MAVFITTAAFPTAAVSLASGEAAPDGSIKPDSLLAAAFDESSDTATGTEVTEEPLPPAEEPMATAYEDATNILLRETTLGPGGWESKSFAAEDLLMGVP